MTRVILCCDDFHRLEETLDRLDPKGERGFLIAQTFEAAQKLLVVHSDAEIHLCSTEPIVRLKVIPD